METTIECHGERLKVVDSSVHRLPTRNDDVLYLPEGYDHCRIPSPRNEVVHLGWREPEDPLVLFGVDEHSFLSYLTEDAKSMLKELFVQGTRTLRPSGLKRTTARQGEVFVERENKIGELVRKAGRLRVLTPGYIRGTTHRVGAEREAAGKELPGNCVYYVPKDVELEAGDHKPKLLKEGSTVRFEKARYHPEHDHPGRLRGVD